MKDRNKEEIFIALQKGDNATLSDLFAAHAEYCIGRLQTETNCQMEDAKDIFVDAVLRMREHAISGQMTYLSNARSYLYRICYQMYLSHHRNQNGRRKKADLVQRYYYEELERDGRSEKMKTEHMFELLHTGLNQLGIKCRELLERFYYKRQRMREIAAEMRFANESVVATSKNRCMKKLILQVQSLGANEFKEE